MVTLTGGDLIGLFEVSLTWAWALSKFLKVTLFVAGRKKKQKIFINYFLQKQIGDMYFFFIDKGFLPKIDPVVDGDGSFTGLVLLREKKAKL